MGLLEVARWGFSQQCNRASSLPDFCCFIKDFFMVVSTPDYGGGIPIKFTGKTPFTMLIVEST